jgi:hypothetical protein
VVESLAATVEVVTAAPVGEVIPASTGAAGVVAATVGEVSPVGRFVLERAVAEVIDPAVEVVSPAPARETSRAGRFVLERAVAEVIDPAPEVVKVVFHRDLLRYADFADLADLAGRPDGPARANEALRYLSTPEGAERLKAAVIRSYKTALHTAHAGVIPRRPPEMPATAVANLTWPFEVVCEGRPANWLLSDPARFAVRFARSPAASPAEWLITARDARVYPDLTDRMVAALEAAEPLYRRNLDELERVGGFKTLLGDYNNQTVTDLAVKFRAAVVKSTGLAVDDGNVVGFPHRSHLYSLLVGNEAAVSAQLAVNGLFVEYTPEVLVRGVPFDVYADLAAKDWAYLLHAHGTGMSADEFLRGYPTQLSTRWVHHWVRTYSSENVPLPTQAVLNRYSGHFNRVVSIYLNNPANAAQPPELAHRVVHGTLKKLVQGGLSGK